MGWIADGAEDHEGFVATVAPNGRTSGTSNAAGILLSRPDWAERTREAYKNGGSPSDADLYEQVPWSETLGFRVECSCGWHGTSWSRADTITSVDEKDGVYAESSLLPDGRTVDEAGEDEWLAHIRPIRGAAAIADAAAAVRAAQATLDEAVAAARQTDPPASWAVIGRAAGMTRQSAHDRWGRQRDEAL